ncbi:hypothetical protein GCM10023229_02880 [Flavisolibacter ginsenosidimutans]
MGIVTVLSLACQATDLIIVNSTQQATIYVSSSVDLNSTEIYAAQELRYVIAKMTGKTLSIVRTAGTGPQIVIGTPAANQLVAANSTALQLSGSNVNDEHISVLRSGNNLFLAGKTPRAALYAVYTFLEDYLNVRWLWPGNSGEFIPSRSAITINTLSISQTPLLVNRSLAIVDAANGSYPETDTWMARNKMNVAGFNIGDTDTVTMERRKQKGFLARIGGHNIVLDTDTLKAHPTWAALQPDGTRPISATSQLCWGNTGVQNAVAEMIAQWWDENPLVDIVHFYPADNQAYCKDGLCTSLGGDVSTRWQNFSKIVIAKVEQTHPNKRYWTYAYQGYRPSPQTTAAPFEFVGYTLENACYRHSFMSSADATDTTALSEINGWRTRNVKMGIRGYEYIMFTDPMFVPLVNWETEQMQWINSNGLTGYLSEIPPYSIPASAAPENTRWNTNRMNLYAAAKAMWSNVSADSIVNDWYATIYGAVQNPMRDYYKTIDTAWRNATGDIKKYNNAPASEADKFLSISKNAKLNNYFTIARTNVEQYITDSALAEKVNSQIDLESKMFKNWQTIYNYKTERAYRYKTKVIKTSQISSSIWDTIVPLPVFEDNFGQPVSEQTDVKMAWTSTSLALHIVCHDNNVANRVQNAAANDDTQIPLDDCIELLIQKDGANPEYYRFAVNSKVSTPYKYDAYTMGGTLFAKSWTPSAGWTAKTSASTTNKIWTVDITIPFSSLGITAADSTQFRMMIKRNRADSADSGWPDAAFYRQNSYADVMLVNEIVNPLTDRIILYDQGDSNRFPISVEFQKRNWQVTSGISGETALGEKLNEDAAILLIKYPSSGFLLSSSFFQHQITDFISKGRVVIFFGNNIPVNTLFSGLPSLSWGADDNASRKTTAYASGGWLTSPNDLTEVVRTGITPQTVYIPTTGWKSLAKMDRISGADQPYLLSYRIGNGLLVLTTSALGYSGGFEMFGNSYLVNTVKLVENFRQFQDDSIYSYQQASLTSRRIISEIQRLSVVDQKNSLKIQAADNSVIHAVVNVAESGNAEISVTDIGGHKLGSVKLYLEKGQNLVDVPVSLSARGLYIATVITRSKNFSIKFLK